MRNFIALFFLSFLVFSCASSTEDVTHAPLHDTDAERTETPTLAVKQNSMPATKQLPISIEGVQEEIDVKLYRTPATYPLPFYVYIPQEMEAAEASTEEAEIIRFSKGPASLGLHVLMKGVDEDMAKKKAKELVRKRGNMKRNETEEEKIYYLADNSKNIYTTEVRKRNGRFFILTTEMPVEYADGYIPRTQMIAENIVWQ